jgi:chemotaxis protein methyltransferase CheR
MDAIFCRNVIIYFDLDAKKRVIRTLHDRLIPGGYLLLGHSESLINISTDFKLRHFTNDMLYQKPGTEGQVEGGLDNASD